MALRTQTRQYHHITISGNFSVYKGRLFGRLNENEKLANYGIIVAHGQSEGDMNEYEVLLVGARNLPKYDVNTITTEMKKCVRLAMNREPTSNIVYAQIEIERLDRTTSRLTLMDYKCMINEKINENHINRLWLYYKEAKSHWMCTAEQFSFSIPCVAANKKFLGLKKVESIYQEVTQFLPLAMEESDVSIVVLVESSESEEESDVSEEESEVSEEEESEMSDESEENDSFVTVDSEFVPDYIEEHHVYVNCGSPLALPSAGESAAFSNFLSHGLESNKRKNEDSESNNSRDSSTEDEELVERPAKRPMFFLD